MIEEKFVKLIFTYVSFLGSGFDTDWNFYLKIVNSANFFDTWIDAIRFTLNYRNWKIFKSYV